jgi:hypothetical protein
LTGHQRKLITMINRNIGPRLVMLSGHVPITGTRPPLQTAFRVIRAATAVPVCKRVSKRWIQTFKATSYSTSIDSTRLFELLQQSPCSQVFGFTYRSVPPTVAAAKDNSANNGSTVERDTFYDRSILPSGICCRILLQFAKRHARDQLLGHTSIARR